MSFRKFASIAFLEAHMAGDGGFSKSAHRAVFNYTPREGYLYVRSRAISSRCNDNFDMFPAEEIEKSYLTFIGKPVFVNHHNEDHRRARGVIIDAALHKDRNPDGSPDTWSEVLMEVDAVRFPRLAKAILAGEVDRTSMGCDVQLSKCSVCGNEATSPLQYCAHIPGKKGKKVYKIDPRTGSKSAQLVFEICSGLSFFENSLLVEAPADPTAFFLGNVEVGPGLEHLTAGMNKTAAFHPASPTGLNEAYHVHETNETDGYDSGFTPGDKGIDVHDYPRAIGELRNNWQIHDDNLQDEYNPDKKRDSLRRREVGKLINSLEEHHRKTSSHVWSLLKQAAAPVQEDYRLIGENEARGNSRPVSEEEFHEIAQRGRSRYNAMTRNKQTTQGLEDNWDNVKQHAYQATRHPWGGATYNTRTGLPIKSDADIYAMTVRPTGEHHPISVATDAPEHEFHAAMDHARDKYADHLANRGHHLGVFHDADEGRIDIDPVTLLDNQKQVEEIGAYKGSVGGAYHFKSGNGFWPPHVRGLRTQAALHPYAWNPDGRTIPFSFQEGAEFQRQNYQTQYMHDAQPLNTWSLLKQAATEPFNPAWYQESMPMPAPQQIVSLIHEAQRTGDDLYDWDFVAAASNSWVDDATGLRVTAATNDETDDWHRDHRSHPKNLTDLFNFAVDHNYHKDLPKMEDHGEAVHHGMNWYAGMHSVGNAMAGAAHPSLKKDSTGKDNPDLLRHRVFGALAVYSEGTDVPMNYHQASLATSKGRPLWSKDTGMSKDEQTHEFGQVKDSDASSPTKGQMVPGKPKSMQTQAEKVGLLFSPNLKHMHEVVKAAKTANYGALGMHGGDEEGTQHGIDHVLSGHGQGGRVVIDRHALSAAIGHRIDGVDFNSAGLSKYQKPTKANPGELSHLHTQYGNDENKHYSYVADAYRVAAAHLSQHHGREITPQQVQAVTWGARKHLNDSGIQHVSSLPEKKSSWKSSDEDMWKGVVNAKHSWINDADNQSMDRDRSFKDRPNTRNINNWERHLDNNPSIGEPINKSFGPHSPRGHWGKKLAYGETKSPEDVDTLRSENCTVCGNSSAWDGTQCQVCGYTAPPRPFGDPNTDIAQQKDIRKQVLDGNEADPNDPDQQLGQQLGDPGELQDQQDAAAAGEDTQMGPLTCNVCGTGVQPAPPTSESGGEPPYPADGDVCPICQKGQLLSGAEEGGAPMGDEAEMDSADAEEGQEGNAPGGANQQEAEEDDGDQDENDESMGRSDASDDDDQDDGDSFDPKQKADKNQKKSAFVPVWWKPVWWRG